MRASSRLVTVLVGCGFVALAAAGCVGPAADTLTSATAPSSATATTPTAETPPPSSTATPTPTPTPTPTCSSLTEEEAFQQSVADVPLPSFLPDRAWVPAIADEAGYDPCAALSWITVVIDGATVSSPNHIMLFHEGEYLGTATKIAYGFTPRVERVDDATIRVTYRYLMPGEANAQASGQAVATFTWDAASQSVTMQGDVPPDGIE